jgi:group I intron endonuclease
MNLEEEKLYIGSSMDVEFRLHFHRGRLRRNAHWNKRLQMDWNRLGENAFAFALLEKTKSLIRSEQQWMDELEAFGPMGYNVCPMAGTRLGSKSSDETKAKISASHLARPQFTKTHCRNISKAKIGFRFTQESKNKMRASALRRWRDV